MSTEFLITSLIVVIAPGTGVVYTLMTALARGSGASVIAAAGCTLGIIPHMAAAILGLAAVLHTSALVFTAFKYAGLAYLLYLAWSTLRDRSLIELAEPETGASGNPAGRQLAILTRGFLINILNPKLSIFFLAFLPQFVTPESAAIGREMVQLSLVFMVMTFVVFVGYGLFAASVRRHLLGRPAIVCWMRRVFAGAFAGLGLKLAMSETS